MVASGSAFEEHLARKTLASQQFHAADAENILHMAACARSRVISQVQAGQLVYYYRRGKQKSDQGYRGPAKVIAVEKGQGEAPYGGMAQPCWNLDPSGARTSPNGNFSGNSHV